MPERLRHEPVLHSREESEVMRLLSPKPGDMVLDATLGLGGHALGFLERIGSGDGSPDWISTRKTFLLPGSPFAFSKQIDVRHGNFRDLRIFRNLTSFSPTSVSVRRISTMRHAGSPSGRTRRSISALTVPAGVRRLNFWNEPPRTRSRAFFNSTANSAALTNFSRAEERSESFADNKGIKGSC